jgi:two-component sensor histidine kinase
LEGLRERFDDDLLERSRLAVTELITNAIKHAGARSPDLVEVEVLRPGHPKTGPSRPHRGRLGASAVRPTLRPLGVDFSHSTRVWLEFDRH